MKKITGLVLFFSILFLLSSCGEDSKVTEIQEKRDFYVEVESFDNFSNAAKLNKTWRLTSTQNINLTSNANWKVANINVKVGDEVKAGQILLSLSDSVANYWLTLESSKNSINSVKNSLNVAKNNLEKAKLNYESTKNTLDKNIADLERNLNNMDSTNSSTSTSIEIAKIDNSIEKLDIDYNNLLTTNNVTKNSYTKSLEKEIVIISNYLDDIILFSDEILGVTDLNRMKNDSYEIYLWAKNNSQKLSTESLLKDLINFKNNELISYKIEINSDEDYKKYINEINNIYEKILTFLTSFDVTLGNTPSSDVLNDTAISNFRSRISTFKTLYNQYKQAFLSLENQIISFLDTYNSSVLWLVKQIENLKKDREIYEKSLWLNVESVEWNLEEAKKNREISLKNLEIIIRDAEIALEDANIRLRDAEISNKLAQIQYDKLFIKSTINWVVNSILVDRWQEIWIGTPVISLVSKWENEVTISFTKDELAYVKEWMQAIYNDWVNTHTWTIYSISATADENLRYTSKVSFPAGTSYIWSILNIEIPIVLDNKLLPLNALTVTDSSYATLKYLSPLNDIEELRVKVGNVYSDKIEVIDDIDPTINVILNYVDNYDPDKFNLIVKEYNE